MRKGFTTTELVIVITIIAIISIVSVYQYTSSREKHGINKDASAIVSLIQNAREMSKASKDDSNYGIIFSSTTVSVFANTDDNIISVYNTDNLSLLNLSNNSNKVIFSKISGRPNATGTITYSSSNFSKTITIYQTGLVEINN